MHFEPWQWPHERGVILVRQQCIHLLVSTGVLALWWTYLHSRKAASIRRPSLMTTLMLAKKSYVPVDAVKGPEKPYFTTVP